MTLYILRGLPGSGKSNLAANLVQDTNGDIFSADYYFTSVEGFKLKYNFDGSKLGEAHAYCFGGVEAMLRMRRDAILDNTNIKVAHFQKYLNAARLFHEDVEIIMPETAWAWDVDECFKRGVHGVPKETIQRMKDQFEEFKL